MEIKAIIREMIKKGMTEDEIRASLQELGIENAEELVKQATEQMKEVPLAEQTPVQQQEAPAPSQAEEEEKEKELFEPISPQTKEKTEEEKPLSYTTISGEEEKEITYEAPKKEQVKEELVASMPKTSFSDIDAIEKKLDETISLLRALQDINKKILDTERSVLLRLKT